MPRVTFAGTTPPAAGVVTLRGLPCCLGWLLAAMVAGSSNGLPPVDVGGVGVIFEMSNAAAVVWLLLIPMIIRGASLKKDISRFESS